MKKTLYALSVIAIAFTSCSKDDGSSDLAKPVASESVVVPSSFGKKVMIEELTGAWCGYCPRGTYNFDTVAKVFNKITEKVIGVSIHVSDVMEASQLVNSSGNMLYQMFQPSNPGYPNGSIDRGALSDPVDWMSLMPSDVSLWAKCGFSIDATAISGSTLTLVVHTGFAADMFGDYRLNVFVVEADVHSTDAMYDQHNYYSQSGSNPDPTSIYYNQPPLMNDFHHQNVLRKLVTSVPYGDNIPQSNMVKGKDYARTFSVNLSAASLHTSSYSNCYIVVFVDKYGTDLSQHQIQNVQKVKIGQSIGWN